MFELGDILLEILLEDIFVVLAKVEVRLELWIVLELQELFF